MPLVGFLDIFGRQGVRSTLAVAPQKLLSPARGEARPGWTAALTPVLPRLRVVLTSLVERWGAFCARRGGGAIRAPGGPCLSEPGFPLCDFRGSLRPALGRAGTLHFQAGKRSRVLEPNQMLTVFRHFYHNIGIEHIGQIKWKFYYLSLSLLYNLSGLRGLGLGWLLARVPFLARGADAGATGVLWGVRWVVTQVRTARGGECLQVTVWRWGRAGALLRHPATATQRGSCSHTAPRVGLPWQKWLDLLCQLSPCPEGSNRPRARVQGWLRNSVAVLLTKPSQTRVWY